MTMQEGVLTWPFVQMCDLATITPTLTDAQQQQAVALAVEWLWSKSARRYGTRPVLLRPQTRSRGMRPWPGIGLQPMSSVISGLSSGWMDGEGTREHDQVLELPAPVVSVESVEIDGVTVDPDVWRLENNYLVRQDGGIWPRTQNLIAALGQPNTWAVRFTRGFAVTDFGMYATGKLVCYFGKQIAGGKPCELPYNTTNVTRAGVSISRSTGKGQAAQTSPVPEVDQWLAMVNPDQLRSEPVIWSPDVDRQRWPYYGSYMCTDTVPEGVEVTEGFLVLGPTDPVPAGTPVGTVIFRTEG